ncbi:MAG: hypothetical protein ACI814_002986 [Mariniblastus sp.]|jgi:hypothetical protein
MSKLSRRQFVTKTAGAGVGVGVMSSLPGSALRASSYPMANDSINLGFVSCGGRAGQLAGQFSKSEGVNIVGLCDPDEQRIANLKKTYNKAKGYRDLRALFDADDVDATVVATCNHWHCLAAIWAMESGKDVYVEKPLSHSQWEGEQTVAAARRYNRICQIGTQQRSDPMQAKIKKFLHEEKGIGELKACRVNRFGIRNSIGKRETPLEIDKSIAYDLWLGPAQDLPVFRKNLHYDWHWDWNTGSGEMGNWGVHVLDDVRNNVFQDKVTVPKRIFGGGGRLAWNDAGNTPNVHFVYFDTGTIPVVIGLSNLPVAVGSKKAAPHPGPNSGYVVYGEGGYFHGQRGNGAAYDNEGKKIKEFGGTRGDVLHQKNFLDAVRSRDRSSLNAEVEVGHHSTGWCNLANIAYRAGSKFSSDQAKEVNLKQWTTLIGEMEAHTKVHGIKMESDQVRLSPMLELNTESQRFVGENAAVANKYIKREYRTGYEVPELAGAALSK